MLAIAVVALVFWKILLLFAFDPEGAAVAGYPVEIIRYGLLLALALTVAIAMKIVGILLVGAFLVVPATASGFWSARPARVAGLAVVLALISALSGIVVAIVLNAPAGATIVLALVTLFLIGRLFGPYRK